MLSSSLIYYYFHRRGKQQDFRQSARPRTRNLSGWRTDWWRTQPTACGGHHCASGTNDSHLVRNVGSFGHGADDRHRSPAHNHPGAVLGGDELALRSFRQPSIAFASSCTAWSWHSFFTDVLQACLRGELSIVLHFISHRSIRRFDRNFAADVRDPVNCRARPQDLAVIISSGGSTGVPKGSWRHFTDSGAPTVSRLPAREVDPSKSLQRSPLKLGPGPRAHLGIQESGVQELENLGAWRRFSQGDAGPRFSEKGLARVFCNSCNS
jgi:hypothetical protein